MRRRVDLTLADLRQGAAPSSVLACLAAGLMLGAGLGAFELAFAVDLDQPSVGRRAVGLLFFAGIQSGVLLGSLFFLASLWTGFAHRREWRSALGAARPCYLGALAGLLVLVALVLEFGEGRALESLEVRLAWCGAFVLAALLAGGVVSRLLVGVPGLARAIGTLLRVPIAAVFFAVLAGTSFFMVDPASFRSEPGIEVGGAAPEGAPNVIVIVVDTLRADVLGAYGSPESGEGRAAGEKRRTARTPVMDDLAAEGALYEQAIAPSSWTLPSVTSLFTSRLPNDHGFVTFDGVVPEELAGLPATLAEAGYSCRAVVANQLVNPDRGFARGFEVYDVYGYECEGDLLVSRLFDRLMHLCGPRRSYGPAKRPFLRLLDHPPFVGTAMTHYVYDEDVTARVFRHALEPTERPLFLYVHYLAPHSPYLEHPLAFLPGQPTFLPENADALWRNYLGEVAYTDAAIGTLLEGLEERGLLDDAVVVLTSDHGEEFREHGKWLHGNGLYQEVVRVPLLLSAPGVAPGTRVSAPVSLIDVAPTILDLVGVEPPGTFHGASLPTAPGDAAGPVVTELLPKIPSTKHAYFAVMQGDRKVISRRSATGGEEEVLEIYDLARDAGETMPLDVNAEALGPLLQLLAERAGMEASGASKEISAEELERLKALGYVDE